MHRNRNEWDGLISEIRRVAETPGHATTSGPPFDFPFAAVSNEAIDVAERAIGFQLPVLLRRVYSEVGNGGFGPGHGLLSIHPLSVADYPVPKCYAKLKSQKPDWPPGMIPFCDWGCFIFSCIDLTSDDLDPAVLRFEPNMTYEDTAAYCINEKVRSAGLVPERNALSKWFGDWIGGIEMFDRPYLANR